MKATATGTGSLSDYAMDTFVAQEISALTAPVARSIAGEFPDYGSWLHTLVLTTIFTSPKTQQGAGLAFALVRRAQAAIEDYDEACTRLGNFVQGGRSITDYFRALRRFESATALAWQAFDFGRKALGLRLFTPGDGSSYERLNGVYNSSRHLGLTALPAEHLHTIWLRNDEICTELATLRFGEFEDILRELGQLAEKISKGNLSP